MREREIEEFGRRLGLEGLRLGENSAVSLAVGEIGVLTLQAGEGNQKDALLMTLARPVESAAAPEIYARALERAGWRAALPQPVSAALFRDRLVLGVRLPAEAATAAQLENAFRLLLAEVP